MKRLRSIGTGLFVVGWVAALALRYALPKPSAAYLVAASIAMVGVVMVLIPSLARLFKGKVRLRPLRAARVAPFHLALYFAIWWIWRLAFPDDQRDLLLDLVSAITLAATLSLYFTAYRKPE